MQQGPDELWHCHAEQNKVGVDLVLGGPLWRYQTCREARQERSSISLYCTPAGHWFEPKPEQAKVAAKLPKAPGELTLEDFS